MRLKKKSDAHEENMSLTVCAMRWSLLFYKIKRTELQQLQKFKRVQFKKKKKNLLV